MGPGQRPPPGRVFPPEAVEVLRLLARGAERAEFTKRQVKVRHFGVEHSSPGEVRHQDGLGR